MSQSVSHLNPCSRVFLSHHWPGSTSCDQACVRLCDHLSGCPAQPVVSPGGSQPLILPSPGGGGVHIPEEFQPQDEVAAL